MLPIAGLIALGALGAALGGLAAGTALGGLVGILKDNGVTDEEAQLFAKGVERGGSLVTLHGISSDREKQARKILEDHDALDVEEVEEDQPTSEVGS